MSTTITHRASIPDASFYVLANDSFMSGWGPAKDKTNTVILPCDSFEQASIVEANAGNRTDMKRVRIVANKPLLRSGVLYSLMSKADASRWYEKGGF